MTDKKTLHIEMRAGETVSIDDGRVSATLIKKSGQVARMQFRATADVRIQKMPATGDKGGFVAAQMARGGLGMQRE